MSSADEMENYKAWRKTELTPVRQLAVGGHVDVFNFNPDRLRKMVNIQGSLLLAGIRSRTRVIRRKAFIVANAGGIRTEVTSCDTPSLERSAAA